jgi:hypothetical protein
MEQRCLPTVWFSLQLDPGAASKEMELGFLDYAIKQYGRGTKRTRSGILDEGPEIVNELVEL